MRAVTKDLRSLGGASSSLVSGSTDGAADTT